MSEELQGTTPSHVLIVDEPNVPLAEAIAEAQPGAVVKVPEGTDPEGVQVLQVNAEKMAETAREVRRNMVLDLAKRLYQTDHRVAGIVVAVHPFDKSDVSHQKYIRYAEEAFDWMIKR